MSKATSNQFRQKFTEAGASGYSVRKCIGFFLSAAKEANVEVSPYIAETVRQQSETKPRKLPVKAATKTQRVANNSEGASDYAKKEPSQLSREQMLLAKFPSFDPAWPDEVKKEWFTAFHQMMKIGEPHSAPDKEDADNEHDSD